MQLVQCTGKRATGAKRGKTRGGPVTIGNVTKLCKKQPVTSYQARKNPEPTPRAQERTLPDPDTLHKIWFRSWRALLKLPKRFITKNFHF